MTKQVLKGTKKEADGRIVKEDQYILEVLENFIVDLKTDTPVTRLIDAYACQLTAYMQGQVEATHD